MLSYDKELADITKRKRAEEVLRESEERFRSTFEQAAVGIAHVAPDGRFLRINQRFYDIVGYTQAEMLSRTFQDITHADDLEADLNHLQQLLAGKIQTYSKEKRYIRKDGSLVWVNLTVALVREPSGDPKYFISVVENISQRKQVEETLRKSEERCRTLFEESKDVVFISTAEGKFIDINPAGVELFGYASKEEILQINIAQELYENPRDREVINQILEDKGFVKNYELVLKKKDGQKITVLESATVVRDEHGKVIDYRGIIHDLTERKQAERELQKTSGQLRALAAHLQSVREEERTAIAREMHDELGQVLTVLKMDLTMLKKEVNRCGEQKIAANLSNEINSMMKLVDKTIKKVRRLITDLRPEVLDSLGLISALEWQAEEFKHRTDINGTFNTDAREIEFDKDLSIAVFRIVQEALTNVARHSKARQVDIHLTKNNGFLELKIRDDGVGFSKNKLDNDKTFGVLGMKERALILSGEVQIEATEGHGTTVKARIPIR